MDKENCTCLINYLKNVHKMNKSEIISIVWVAYGLDAGKTEELYDEIMIHGE